MGSAGTSRVSLLISILRLNLVGIDKPPKHVLIAGSIGRKGRGIEKTASAMTKEARSRKQTKSPLLVFKVFRVCGSIQEHPLISIKSPINVMLLVT